jgi:ribosome maturation factor RimP
MSGGDWKERLKAFALQACAGQGLDLYDLETIQTGKSWVVRLTLDSLERPITLNDCESVSRGLSAAMDVEDVIPHAYTLEVSSPGLERKLKDLKDFIRFKGGKANVVYDTISESVPHGFIEGEIIEVVGDIITVKPENGPALEIPYQKIKRAKLVFDFSK